jgi:protein-S-isoprenylcysteine O-methyltransferase Ste14
MAQSSTGAVNGGDLQQLQRRRKQVLRAGALLCVLLLLVTDSSWRLANPTIFMSLQRTGFVLILLCIFGRTWCTLYIGGRKKRELITKGPYSIVRNPLYVFTIVGALGLGLLAGSIAISSLFGALALLVFNAVARQEEAFLASAFGDSFASYAARVPRFRPRPSAWQDVPEVVASPKLVVRTFFDASLFLLAVPLLDLKETLQHHGFLPVWLLLP